MAMKLAYAVLAHHKPAQLRRLFRAIWRPQHWYAVHIDRRASAECHDTARQLAQMSNVTLLPSVPCVWGGWNIVRTELRAIRQLLQMGEWSYFVTLSGQDFPLRTQEQIVSEMERMPIRDWISIETHDPEREIERRRRERMFVLELASRNKVVRIPLPPFWRPPLLGKRRSIGAQWKILTRDTCAWLAPPSHTRRYRAAYWGMLLADESFFQTVLINSIHRSRIAGRNLHFIDWENGPEYPRVFRMEDLPRLEQSEAFFARKFDSAVDDEVLRALEHRLGVPPFTSSSERNIA